MQIKPASRRHLRSTRGG